MWVLLFEKALDPRQRGFDTALHQLIAVAAQQSTPGHDAHVETRFREDLTVSVSNVPVPEGSTRKVQRVFESSTSKENF